MILAQECSSIIPIVVGFDPREAVAYHTFCQSVLEKATVPVAFVPLVLNTLTEYNEKHTDGSNGFIYSRFLTPFLMGFNGWAIFADGDMVCREDIAKLWEVRDDSKAVMVVKHDYKTTSPIKYLGNQNVNYPRKNWSSLILWNCAHPKNRLLRPNYIENASGAHLHRFAWLEDQDIGEIEIRWNWLATEFPSRNDAKLVHYTLGTPCFKEYRNSSMSEYWHQNFRRMIAGIQYDLPFSCTDSDRNENS